MERLIEGLLMLSIYSCGITRNHGIPYDQPTIMANLTQVPIDEDDWLDGNMAQELARQEGRVQGDLINWSIINSQKEEEDTLEVNIKEQLNTPSPTISEPWTTGDVIQRMNDVIDEALENETTIRKIKRSIGGFVDTSQFPTDYEGFRQAVLEHQRWFNNIYQQDQQRKKNSDKVPPEQIIYSTQAGTVLRGAFHADDGIADLTFLVPTSTEQYYMTISMEKLEEDLLEELVMDWNNLLSIYDHREAYGLWNQQSRLLKYGGRVDCMMFTKDNYVHPYDPTKE